MNNKYVFFSDGRGEIAQSIAGHFRNIGYTPLLNWVDTDIDLLNYNALTQYFYTLNEELYGVIYFAPEPIRSTIEAATDEMWADAREGFAVSALNLTRAAGNAMAKLKRGSIIYLNTIHADKPLGEGFLFSMGCASVQMLCREAALIYGLDGVGCFNIMRPAIVGEDWSSDFSPIYHNPQYRFPDMRLTRADEYNELAAFLLTPAAFILNGTDLQADKGFTMYYGKIY